MTTVRRVPVELRSAQWRQYGKNVQRGLATFADDVAQGFFDMLHNSFALLGLAVVMGLIFISSRNDLRQAGEIQLMTWLKNRHEIPAVVAEPEPEPALRAVAVHPKDLPSSQAAVAFWLSRKYGVAAEPLSLLVNQAFDIAHKARLDPTLILAIMAIESGFNPFAQSPVGAQGLMQVMTKIHQDKYENFGGQLSAFDPVTNLRVGVKVLQECIARAGSVEGGLKFYVGAANLPDDGGYTSKVLAEHARLQAVAIAAAKGTGKLSFVVFNPAAQKAAVPAHSGSAVAAPGTTEPAMHSSPLSMPVAEPASEAKKITDADSDKLAMLHLN